MVEGISSWDDKAYEYAEARGGEYFGYLPEQMFENGAKWQRDQLRTNEAIEQAADILSFETTNGCYPKADEQCRHVMRRVLNTLLGEDQ